MLRRLLSARRPEGSSSPQEAADGRRPRRWRTSGLVLAVGVVIGLTGAFVSLEPWYEAVQWRGSPEAANAQRNLNAPTPVWITPRAAVPASTALAASPARTSGQLAAPAAPPRAEDGGPLARPAPIALPTPVAATPVGTATEAPTPTLEPSPLELGTTEFAFIDPPEPGAAARLTVSVANPSDQTDGPIALLLPLDWLSGYRIEATQPPTANGAPTGGDRTPDGQRLLFDAPAPGADVTLTIDLVATAEVIDPPLVRVVDGRGRSAGSAQPPTEAPQPRPGPVWAITIPRLDLSTGVVQVDWEPPLFVVGQIRTSAHVTEGNSVLVGHVRGAAGYNVFDHLDRLATGDVIVATSRGVPYRFVVDRTEVLPEDDTSPTDPTATPQLTLMTCAGDWNPITRDYSDRLWVIAEPQDTDATANATATGDNATPAVTAEGTPTPARATRTAEAAATPRAGETPVALASPVSTGAAASASPATLAQISPPGGLGNTDADLAKAFGPPQGESANKLAVYPRLGQRPERRAQLVEVPGSSGRRAVLVAAVPVAGAPLAFADAVQLSRGLLPTDAQPRAAGPEGNTRFAVERFTSPTLASLLPAELFASRQGQPGDFVVVYTRRPDGRVTSVSVSIGDDPQPVLAALSDI